MSAPAQLVLTIRNADPLDNGSPLTLELAQRNATIGRSPTCDWSLPDPRSFISSRHCEISYIGGEYRLSDRSTNGTFLNGSPDRMRGPHILCDGDHFQVGHYEIAVSVTGGERDAREIAAEPPPHWTGWSESEKPREPDSHWSTDGPARPPAPGGWDDLPANPAPSAGASDGWNPLPPAPAPSGGGWPASASHTPVPPPGSTSPWDMPEPASTPSSAWSTPTHGAAPAAEDAWGKLADSYAVDWNRGGFGASSPPGMPETHAFAPPPVQAPPPTPAPSPSTPAPGPAPQASPPADAGQAMALLLEAAGVPSNLIQGSEAEVMAAAGDLLRRLVAGLVVMIEARARAKSQMGAQTTIYTREGNNPIKFARSPDLALAQLLNPPLSGYMPATNAVEDSFRDLQLHQIATLKAMQGALRATLARFSPEAIRKRADGAGGISRVLPGMRDAALWRAYEREFSGVAQGSDEAFMDVFAKEFRRAYEEQTQTGI